MAILTQREVRRKPRRRRGFDLTAAEQTNVRRALRAIRERYGGWPAFARALRCNPDTLTKAATIDSDRRYAASPGLALRAAQLVGVPVEDILSGAWLKDVACPLCGRTG